MSLLESAWLDTIGFCNIHPDILELAVEIRRSVYLWTGNGIITSLFELASLLMSLFLMSCLA